MDGGPNRQCIPLDSRLYWLRFYHAALSKGCTSTWCNIWATILQEMYITMKLPQWKDLKGKIAQVKCFQKTLELQAKFEFVHKYGMQMVSDTFYFASIVKETTFFRSQKYTIENMWLFFILYLNFSSEHFTQKYQWNTFALSDFFSC